VNPTNDLPYIFVLYMFFNGLLIKLIDREIDEFKKKLEIMEKEIEQLKVRRDKK
jgi:hypothetical protein